MRREAELEQQLRQSEGRQTLMLQKLQGVTANSAEQNAQLFPGEFEQLFDDYTTCVDISLVKS